MNALQVRLLLETTYHFYALQIGAESFALLKKRHFGSDPDLNAISDDSLRGFNEFVRVQLLSGY